jgi:hypothetical protein
MCKNCFAIIMEQLFFLLSSDAGRCSFCQRNDGWRLKKERGLMMAIMLDGYLNDDADRAGQLATIWDLPAVGCIFFHHESFLFILKMYIYHKVN